MSSGYLLYRSACHFWRLLGVQLLIAGTALGMWLAVREFTDVSTFILPSLADVGREFAAYRGLYARAFVRTLGCSALGYLCVACLPLLAAAIHAVSRRFGQGTVVVLVVIQSVPIVALAPIAALILGRGLAFETTIVVLIAGLPVCIIAAKAIAGTPMETMIDACFSRSHTRVHVLLAILRQSKGRTVAVVRGSSPLAVVGAVVAEYVGTGSGLGFLVYHAVVNSDTASLYAGTMLCTACGFLFFALVDTVCLTFLPLGRPVE